MASTRFTASTANLRKATCRSLRDVLAEKIPIARERIKYFRKQHGSTKIGAVTINMLYGGMQGIMGLVCETSAVDADEAVRFRGFTIAECKKCLPKATNGEEPLPEGIFWLLLTGEMPTKQQVEQLSCEWAQRAALPPYIKNMLFLMPSTLHPMSQIFIAITALNHDSRFIKAFNSGVPKSTYWEYAYEDSMDLIAKLPLIAAIIYCNTYRSGKCKPCINYDLDWAENFAMMLGFKECMFTELLRLYLTIHSDHEGGNVCAHAVHLVGSALSDPCLALAAGISGLAGPLHGSANQEVLEWLLKLQTELGPKPTKDQIKEYVLKTLSSEQKLPGYGHTMLRKTDPRYICLHEFALKHLPDDELFKLASMLYEIAPDILTKMGMVKNPWPNMDALSGVLFYYYGMQELKMYSVLFSVSRTLGVLASLIWDRALMLPIEYPKSTSTDMLMKMVQK